MLTLLLVLALVVMIRYRVFGERVYRIASAGMRTGVILGGIGFALGFFGPMLLAPGANQGPLLGILITGPGGFVAGFLGGAGRAFVTDDGD